MDSNSWLLFSLPSTSFAVVSRSFRLAIPARGSWMPPAPTPQRETFRALGSSGARPHTGLPPSSPCPFHTVPLGPSSCPNFTSTPLLALTLVLTWPAASLPTSPSSPTSRPDLPPSSRSLNSWEHRLPASRSTPPEALATGPGLPELRMWGLCPSSVLPASQQQLVLLVPGGGHRPVSLLPQGFFTVSQ